MCLILMSKLNAGVKIVFSNVDNLKHLRHMKKILYVDMDNVLVDFESGILQLDTKTLEQYKDNYDEVPGIFSLMHPIKGAVESFSMLAEYFDTFILSTAPWNNPSAWTDKCLWVKRYIGDIAYKRLIITHRKDLNKGHYLIDDRLKNGAGDFEGELILFGSERFKDWQAVIRHLLHEKD